MRRLELAGAWAASILPFIGLTSAGLDPQCLAGRSSAGLPYIAPAAACFACLWLGWWTWPSQESLWRLISWASLLGASLFARTPLWLALDWHLPRVEMWPLLVICGVLAIRAGIALWSAIGAFRSLGIAAIACIALTVAAPWIEPLAERFPSAIIVLGYGGLAALIGSAAYTYNLSGGHHVPALGDGNTHPQ